jgi:hypothetical protein
MAKGNIDPAFQAAPFFGQSSFDSVQFIEKKNLLEYQQRKQSKLEQDRDMKEGLEKLTLDLKGWEDKAGFDMITKKHEVIRNAAIEAQRKGLNWVSPKTRSDIEAWKGVNDALTGLKQDVDMWDQNKKAVDVINTAIKQDLSKPPDQRRIDYDTTKANLDAQLKNTDLASRNLGLDNIVKYNVQYGDIVKEVIANKAFFKQPTPIQRVNPTTGVVELKEQLSPEDEKENTRRYGILYEGFDQSYKNAVKKQRENDADPDLKVMTDKDYFISQFSLPYREKLIQKPASKSKSGSGGSDMSFGGSIAKITPGIHNTNDNKIGGRNYNDRYDFAANKTFEINASGGAQHVRISSPKTGQDGWGKIDEGGLVKSTLLFYDPNTDNIIFKSAEDANLPWIENNTTFAVPRKNLPEAEKFPIMLENGKQGVLKDILPTTSTPVLKTIGGKNYATPTANKPYIPSQVTSNKPAPTKTESDEFKALPTRVSSRIRERGVEDKAWSIIDNGKKDDDVTFAITSLVNENFPDVSVPDKAIIFNYLISRWQKKSSNKPK